MPPPAIGPEWSVGRRECPRKLLDPMSWPRGKGVILSPISLKKIDYENEYFETEAMLSIRLYQRFFIFFVISFDYDTVITKSSFLS